MARDRGNFFGALGRFLTPERMQVIGHTLQEVGGQRGALDDYLQQRDERAHRDWQRQRIQMQDQREKAAVASLPLDQQVWAMLNPEAYARALAERGSDNGWETGQGYSHAFRTNPDGTVTLGDPLPLRPRAPIQGYILPGDTQDWEYSDE